MSRLSAVFVFLFTILLFTVDHINFISASHASTIIKVPVFIYDSETEKIISEEEQIIYEPVDFIDDDFVLDSIACLVHGDNTVYWIFYSVKSTTVVVRISSIVSAYDPAPQKKDRTLISLLALTAATFKMDDIVILQKDMSVIITKDPLPDDINSKLIKLKDIMGPILD